MTFCVIRFSLGASDPVPVITIPSPFPSSTFPVISVRRGLG